MAKVYLVPGTHEIRIHVDAGGKQCECPVLYVPVGSVGLIVAPIDHEIRKDLLEMPGLLQILRTYDQRISCLKLSES